MASQSTVNTYDGKSVKTCIVNSRTPERDGELFMDALNSAGVDGFFLFEAEDGRWLNIPVRDVQSVESVQVPATE